MPLFCHHCQSEQADGNAVCDQCGAFLPPVRQTRRDLRQMVAVCALLGAVPFLLVAVPKIVGKKPPTGVTRAFPAPLADHLPPDRQGTAQTPPTLSSADPVPFSVTLLSSSAGKHVPVGSRVMIAAYVALAPGQSAALEMSSQKGHAPPTVFAIAQGSLCSAAWTPTAPGKYEFTATAQNNQQNVFSRRFFIWADPPHVAGLNAMAAAPIDIAPVAALPVAAYRPVVISPLPQSLPLPPLRQAAVLRPAAALRPLFLHSRFPVRYHVLVAKFPFSRNADILARALHNNGFHAAVRTIAATDGTIRYAVDTGIYPPGEAQKQAQILQRDGYPAYCYSNR